MGQLVFQATLGGQVNLVGPNTASTFNLNVPAVAGNLITSGDSATVTNTMLAGSIANAKLLNSSVTVGSTSIALGASATTVAGLTLTTPVISTISNTGTLTLPTSTDTLVGRATTDTLTNKTINASQLVDASITQAKFGTNVAGTGPTFSARNSSNQSISSGTFTKVTLDTEDFDTNNNFASSTFTPTVAGYYQINCIVRISGTAVTGSTIAIYKNGSAFTRVAETNSSIGSDFTLSGSSIVSCNGTTDTIEMYANITATSPNFNFANATACCRMSGSLIRSS
jgi:hypothetical protein